MSKADRWRREACEVIRACDQLDWLILTKRPQRIAAHLPADWGDGYRNVWLGTTVESRKYLKRIDALADVPAAIHFLSAEPLFGAINFRPYLSKIDWIITGCEKAHKDKRRRMDLDWVRSIRDQCGDAGVAQLVRHDLGRAMLLKRQLRMAMQVAPQLDQARGEPRDLLFQIRCHGSPFGPF